MVAFLCELLGDLMGFLMLDVLFVLRVSQDNL